MDARDAITKLGGPTQAARKLGLQRGAVAMWVCKRRIPLKHVTAVARALQVAPTELWPELGGWKTEADQVAA